MTLPMQIPIKHADGTVEYLNAYTTPALNIIVLLLLAMQERLDTLEHKVDKALEELAEVGDALA